MNRQLISLALSLLTSCPTLAIAAHREHAPAWHVAPGPSALPLGAELAVVPLQKHRVWFAGAAFWTHSRGQWFRAGHRDDAWHSVAFLNVPEVLRHLNAHDEQRADARIARAIHVAHWDRDSQPAKRAVRAAHDQHKAHKLPSQNDEEAEAVDRAQWEREATRTLAQEHAKR
jgi:hypothetical protein